MFGEIGIVNDHKKRGFYKKTEDRGLPAMCLGLAPDHTSDTYRFLRLNTMTIRTSRDVIWLKMLYGEYKKLKIVHAVHEVSDDEDEDRIKVVHQNIPIVVAPPDDDSVPDTTTAENDHDDNPVVQDVPTINPGVQPLQPRMSLRSHGPVPPPTKVYPKTLHPKVHNALKKIADGNPSAQAMLSKGEESEHGRDKNANNPAISEDGRELVNFMMDEVLFLEMEGMFSTSEVKAAFKDKFEIPDSFDEAWNHKDEFQQKKWREAITKELQKMTDLEVWQIIKKSAKPKERRCVKHRWVFEIKRSGVFRARLVACGYSQIPGIDFEESFSPVANDVTTRILIIAEMMYKLKSKLVDVETAFLHGKIGEGEEIYMNVPEGVEHEDDECLKLNKTIYGLVQAARAFFKTLSSSLMEIGYVQSKIDSCLFVKRSEKGIGFISVHVDDCLMVGTEEILEESIHSLKRFFKLKVEDELRDHLSCEIVFSENKNKAWIGQPHLIKKLEKKFGDLVRAKYDYKTPGTPGFGIRLTKEDENGLTEEDQKIYRSGVGMLLYLVKHSRPDIANPVRELSKGMQKASPAAFAELKRVIRFVLNTKNYGLKLEPILQGDDQVWNMVVYTDSDWAGDKDTRKSVSGYVIFLCGVPILWKSKGQKLISMSSTEAEWYSLSEAAKEIKFVTQLLLSMEIPVKLPVIVRVDNIGAIFMSENVSTSSRTKHVDIRSKFVMEFVEDGFLKIIFVKSEGNVSDILTKNVSGETYESHVDKYVAERSYWNGTNATMNFREGVRE